MKEVEQYILPGFSLDGKVSLPVPVNEQRAVGGKQRTRAVVNDGWSGGWPGKITRRKATAEDIARLEKLSEASLVQLRKDMEKLEEIYPHADGETLALTSD